MDWSRLLDNHVLDAMLICWGLAQALKPPLYFLKHGKWTWGPLFSAGGMPSSHSALVISATMSIGLHEGFDSAVFALAAAMSMVVLYDAAGVRRQAGIHAQKINVLIEELMAGHPISEKQLIEVLGHSPLEVVGGTILGMVGSLMVYWLWA
jgi:hypothetical protein